jgi:ABC-type transport system involved in cytochrome bd biosynthesis fused ATPase/permease subunit
MEKVIEHLRQSEPVNMKDFFNYITVFMTALNIGFAFVTLENLNIITGVLGLFFLLLRNLPMVFVRLWEVGIFLFDKKNRSKIIGLWREEIAKTNNKTTKKGNGS